MVSEFISPRHDSFLPPSDANLKLQASAEVLKDISRYNLNVTRQYVTLYSLLSSSKIPNDRIFRCSTRWNNLLINCRNYFFFFDARVSCEYRFGRFPSHLSAIICAITNVERGIYYAAWYVALFAKKRFRENFRIDTACFSTRERLYSLLFSPLYNNDSFSNPSLSFVILAFKSIDFDLCSSRINYVNPIAISFLCETCSSKETRISEQLYR